MGSVYSNAYVTIAAASSDSCEGGIFSPRCPQLPNCPLPYSDDPSKGNIFIEPHIPFRFTLDTPLNHRAWALQEHRAFSEGVNFQQ